MGKNVSLIDGHIDGADTCAICGREIPEDSKYCIMCGYKQTPKKQRQVDRIRKMSVDELAEFLYSAPDKICFENCTKDTGNKFSCKFGENVDFSNCKKCMKQWLESSTDEGAKENGF